MLVLRHMTAIRTRETKNWVSFQIWAPKFCRSRWVDWCMVLHAGTSWSSHTNRRPLLSIRVWKRCAALSSVCCPFMFSVVSHCLHHVDFLRIVQSWISTNGRHWRANGRSGGLHQRDADEGTLWAEEIRYMPCEWGTQWTRFFFFFF